MPARLGDNENARLAPVWPSLVSLAIVAAASIGSIGVDAFVEHATAEQTTRLLDRSLRSVELADDLRYQARRLAAPQLDREEVVKISSRIGGDAQEQAALVSAHQRGDWDRLKALLDELEVERDPRTKTTLIASIEASLDDLVAAYKSQASEDAEVIRRLHVRLLTADVAAGVVTLVLISLVAIALVRSLRGQRRLLRIHIETVEARERELEAFAARVAHDLRGPLSPIKGYASMLLEPSVDVRDVGRRIGRSVDKMASIVDDMLALSVAGRPPPGVAAIEPIVESVLEDLADAVRESGAIVTVCLERCTVACAQGVLSQILFNLTSNAIKYRSPVRPVEISIEAHALRDHVELRVSDNGLGMSESAAARAFEPFFRASTGTASGHGLGLAIVKRTVDALGGSCELESAPDRGTRIKITLPTTG